MKTAGLPAAHLTVIDERKITRHLLAAGHPAARGKAVFFSRAGFTLANRERFRDALRDHATGAEVVSAIETDFGEKYVLAGDLSAASARSVRIRSVWFMAKGEAMPRLVAAYPIPGVRR